MEAERLLYRDEIDSLKNSISKIDRDTHDSMLKYRSASNLLESEYGRQSPYVVFYESQQVYFIRLPLYRDSAIRPHI